MSAFVDPGDGVNGITFIPQDVQQIEIAHTLQAEQYTVTVTPFFTNLKNVGGFGSPVQVTDVDGTTYVRPPPLSNVKTKVIEIEAGIDLTRNFNLRTAFTWADGESTDNAVWDPGQPGKADDRIVKVPDGKALNQPNIIASVTATYRISRGSIYGTFRQMGSREANASNTFQFTGLSCDRSGGAIRCEPSHEPESHRQKCRQFIRHLSWQGVGGFDGLDRTRTPTDEVFSVVTVQSRAWYLTADFKL